MIYSGRQVFVAQASKSFHKPQAALIGFLPMEYLWRLPFNLVQSG